MQNWCKAAHKFGVRRIVTVTSVRCLGGDTEYPLTGLPINHVLGITHFRKFRRRRESA